MEIRELSMEEKAQGHTGERKITNQCIQSRPKEIFIQAAFNAVG